MKIRSMRSCRLLSREFLRGCLLAVLILAPVVLASAQTGLLDPGFNPGSGANDPINAVARQSDGRIVIAGAFTEFNGVSRSRIARLNSDGSLDPAFDPGTGA